ncbi:hypothetical protein D3C76_1420480 [compost metagenome]
MHSSLSCNFSNITVGAFGEFPIAFKSYNPFRYTHWKNKTCNPIIEAHDICHLLILKNSNVWSLVKQFFNKVFEFRETPYRQRTVVMNNFFCLDFSGVISHDTPQDGVALIFKRGVICKSSIEYIKVFAEKILIC